MNFYEKYPQLKNKAFLSKILTDTVFATMALENQKVEKTVVEKIVKKLLKNKELKGKQFFTN